MEIRQIHTFVQVARLGSFSKAAEMLGYSQSAVTVQIRLLETELETRLFDRMGKKISLTTQGTQFYEHCNRILYELEWIMRTMKTNQELKGSLHIGTIESLCTVKFPSLLNKFHALYPKVNIKITLDAPERLIQMMEHNELDLIYILDAPRWKREWVKVIEEEEPVVFVSSVNSPLAGRKDLSLPDILDEPFFLTEKNSNYRQALDQQLAKKARPLRPILEIYDTEFIIKMIEEHNGLSFLPYFAVEKYVQDGSLAILDIKDIDITMCRQLFYHKDKFCTREMEEFIHLVKESEHESIEPSRT